MYRSPRHERGSLSRIEFACRIQYVLVDNDILGENSAYRLLKIFRLRSVHDCGKTIEFASIRNGIATIGILFWRAHFQPLRIEGLVALVCRSDGIDRVSAKIAPGVPARKYIAFTQGATREFRSDRMDVRRHTVYRYRSPARFQSHLIYALIITPEFHVGSLRVGNMRHLFARQFRIVVPAKQHVIFTLDIGNPMAVANREFHRPKFRTACIEAERNRRQSHRTRHDSAKVRQRVNTDLLSPYRAVYTIIVVTVHYRSDSAVSEQFFCHGGTYTFLI